MLTRPTTVVRNAVIILLLGVMPPCMATAGARTSIPINSIISDLSTFPERSSGSAGHEQAADYITAYLRELGLSPQPYLFQMPVREAIDASLTINETTVALHPLLYNAVSPQAIEGALTGPLYYVGRGDTSDFDRKLIDGAILLMDFNSGQNRLTAASLGARAVIFIDRGVTKTASFFKEKEELSPLRFPCYWMEEAQARRLFGAYENSASGLVHNLVEIRAGMRWQTKTVRNIYCLVEGTDPQLKKEVVIVEAFYDATRYVAGRAPGADEAVSVASLLKLAELFASHPPARSTLFVATSGHAQSLHGMRDLIWSMQERTKNLRDLRRDLRRLIAESTRSLTLLEGLFFPLTQDSERDLFLAEAIKTDLKFEIDRLSRRLVDLRLKARQDQDKKEIAELAARRFALRRIGWTSSFHELEEKEQQLLAALLPNVRRSLTRAVADGKARLASLQSALDFRTLTRDYTIGAILSLHLSSHGRGIGAFHRGWLYRLRPRINRVAAFGTIGAVLEKAAAEPVGEARYIDSLRPSRLHPWYSYFLDRPFLGGEVSSLAGYIGISLVTLGDSRSSWGTPWDTVEGVDHVFVEDQFGLLSAMVRGVGDASRVHDDIFPRNGFSSVAGTGNLLLHGELFADYPAANSVLLSYQGIAKLYTTIHNDGTFLYKGVADKKNVFDKLIIEGYRFDEKNGTVRWAIDKKETGKDNYRLKIQRRAMKTRLIMFPCTQTTIFDLLEPRSLDYMTKLYLFDARRDAPPQRYWYSRIDTRESIISSIYLEPGSRLKLTLSDNVLSRKLILTNGTPEKPLGYGYPVESYPKITNTIYHGARDAWTLLAPRIDNLESHGIHDERIASLRDRGLEAQAAAERQLEALNYSGFKRAAAESAALATRVYTQIETTQKDVLFGVLFYIALFVPFAFCMERFLFCYANIYKRIVAFFSILLGLIFIIYQVHPAFKLAYSPMVVILAFFILGLSCMVSLIIFFRFEEEMILLQRHATHLSVTEISRWKAFVAAFFLGVSNLKRRRLRTILTCTTLIILTFTIMSFTTVKSSIKQNRLFFNQETPYHGLLLKKLNWRSMPAQAVEILTHSMQNISEPAPRIWLEAADPTHTVQVPLRHGTQEATLQGLVGLSRFEAKVTGLDTLLSWGRWFQKGDYHTIILSDSTAAELGITAGKTVTIELWGTPFTVIGAFPGDLLDTTFDLDGEPLTPVVFPEDTTGELSDVEYEAIESGEDVRAFQGRYTHIPASLTAFIPSETLLAMGGSLKNIAVRPDTDTDVNTLASTLMDRFSLTIFSGDDNGVWLYNLSDTIAYSGVPNIIIPLLISILIVLNTMISSVYERKNEIAVYTSVGLAPSHVAFLFIAEAMALAVISVVLGYVTAQVSAAFLASTHFWEGITVNYSSMAGVAAMLLVICVVLISVIYPARVAARIAIPDVNRSFNLPAPVDDSLTVTLPFFMKYHEHQSIGGFIYQYFTGHQDISHGSFSSGHVDLIYSCATVDEIQHAVDTHHDPCAFHCVHLHATVWMAPFDFGIMERIDIQFCPARDNVNFLEIKITIKRKSGEVGQWLRINKEFIHQLRRQLLIWRSMDQERHLQFSEMFRTISEQKMEAKATG